MGHARLPRVGIGLAVHSLRLSAKALELLARLVEGAAGLERGERAHDVVPTPTREPTNGGSVAPAWTDERSTATLSDLGEPLEEEPPLETERHIDREAVLVGESADQGAEDGAGAQLHVSPPWDGYGAMRATDIVDRLVVESDEALSVVLLYEQSTKNRRTVMSAATRELARRGG
jgi:hypothetical protein